GAGRQALRSIEAHLQRPAKMDDRCFFRTLGELEEPLAVHAGRLINAAGDRDRIAWPWSDLQRQADVVDHGVAVPPDEVLQLFLRAVLGYEIVLNPLLIPPQVLMFELALEDVASIDFALPRHGRQPRLAESRKPHALARLGQVA